MADHRRPKTQCPLCKKLSWFKLGESVCGRKDLHLTILLDAPAAPRAAPRAPPAAPRAAPAPCGVTCGVVGCCVEVKYGNFYCKACAKARCFREMCKFCMKYYPTEYLHPTGPGMCFQCDLR